MAWEISNLFPSWGDSGEQPPSNYQYDGGDQVNEKHLDYLWSAVGSLEDEVRSALTDIDSDGDGTVDAADTAAKYKGNDIDKDGDGVVDNADQVGGNNAYELIGGGTNLPTTEIGIGDYAAMSRLSPSAGTTLEITYACVINDNFNTPTGLNFVVYDATNNEMLFSSNESEVSGNPYAQIDVGGKDIIIAANNGDLGQNGTGSTQIVNADMSGRLI